MKFIRCSIMAILLSLLLGVAGGCQQPSAPRTFIDDMGREVTFASIPQRIVSHVPALTEILFALGLSEKVAGVSDYCNYPEETKLKPSVGNYYNPSIENIMNQDPDLVLTDGYSKEIIPQLDNLGVACAVINPEDIDGILKDIQLLGRITGTEKKAEELIADMKNELTRITMLVKDTPKVSVFYVFDATDLNHPWTAGPGSFAHSLITLAGGENIAAGAQSDWVQFSIEMVCDANPEVILVDASMGTAVVSKEELSSHPAWQGGTAVKEGRICVVNGDLVNRPGPRIIQGLEEIAKSIHPELFE